MQRTVGLVGLGVIGQVHLAVLKADPRVTLAFVADPRVDSSDLASAAPRPLPVYEDLAASLRAARRGDLPEPDLIVLATPTSSHLELAAQVLVETASTVLSEKPLTADPQKLREFEMSHADASERVHVVNHFAFSPEVEWAARFVAERAWSTPSMVLSTFNDPYVKKSEAERATYVSSWIDSGPNQIGLLARFVSGGEIQWHTSTSDGMRSITEVGYVGGSAVLSSNWHTGDSSKQTSLRWSDGREILLDHTSMTGMALDGGAPVAHLGGSRARDRKTAHYAAMYDMYQTDPSSRLLSLAFARSTAALLHDATASASPRDALDWVTAPD